MKRIAILASGSGTNAENIIRYFSTGKTAKVVRVFVNKPDAFVIKRSTKLGIPVSVFDRNDLYGTGKVLDDLKREGTDMIVLAGFLWHIPDSITGEYRGRLVNIHPALLPDFGGRGMYGDRVHRAVIESGRKVTGITIHFVNEEYDSGDVIFQAECEVKSDDTPETLAARVHELEYRFYPDIIEKLLKGEPAGRSDVIKH
jgi:phosphoribosylglycinamide formyltransferase 1